ncbi:2-oxoisovalerate dehydrogenase subunit alpha 1, mitochondrial [Selaginella moellendorffii]|uniref:2-oxoisovalerate dehydrogenase subunit alpha 1, mitochondrial n=1 Tax=Selaginella moellendorffii TaxID=88036 RepID=UPI000D1C3959|nr:2-oxoisovalerate dehydrogenase subunit alpha 1, mitochondrial [Selaginella moellendorffii]|eukprot:XP_024536640.1 2-oxoisovalerate dehydrogenase subunit alpha 1, mitochondrial [Selaginella moellendorffii]
MGVLPLLLRGAPKRFLRASGSYRSLYESNSRRRRHGTDAAAADQAVNSGADHRPDDQMLDFPGAKAAFTSRMEFISPNAAEAVPCFRILDDLGRALDGSDIPEIDSSLAVKMYHTMVRLQTFDSIFYEAQRQGRISFYLTNIGEEALNVASAAALTKDDVVFPQYREHGVLMWRGFTLDEFANQCFSNEDGHGKGRQMPIHYGSEKLNYFTISSPIATQLPHAVGAAYGLKMDRKNACAVTYFGDGGSSEGDFHAACNFAAVLEAPVLFVCRNNGYAISTPACEQYKGDGIVVRGRGYGMTSIRVDGNDALAVFKAVSAARKLAVEQSKPVLIEAMTYRVGHHSTSDDSTKYRSGEEIAHWRSVRDPVLRFRRWLESNAWWSVEDEKELRGAARKEVISAMNQAEKKNKPPLSELFTDVYDTLPRNLLEQEATLRDTVSKNPPSLAPH